MPCRTADYIENKYPSNLGQSYAGKCRLSNVLIDIAHRYDVMRGHFKICFEVTHFFPQSFAAAAAFAEASFARGTAAVLVLEGAME